MKQSFSYRQILTIAFPILVATLMEQLIGTTDAAFLGHVGEVELGASALGGVFYITVFMIGMGFSVGAQIMMARRNGEGNYGRIGSIFYHSLAFLVILALVLFLLTRWLAPSVMESIIQSRAVRDATETYINWRIYGFFFAFINVMFRAFYVATTLTRTLTLNSVVMVLSNVVFNYVLIFGFGLVPALGIAGAAIGSTLAEGVSTLFFFIHMRRNVPYARYALDRPPKFRFSVLRRLLSLSIWTMIQNFLSCATWFIFFLATEHLGSTQLAATNIIRNISAFTFMTVISLASTAATLAGNLMGRGETLVVMPMVGKVVKTGYVLLLPMTILIAVFADPVMSVFTSDYTLHEASRGALYVLLVSYFFTVPGQILFYVVSGTGNTRTALAFEFISLFIYTTYVVIACYYLRLDLTWCWASEAVYSFFILILSFLYLRYGRWQLKKI